MQKPQIKNRLKCNSIFLEANRTKKHIQKNNSPELFKIGIIIANTIHKSSWVINYGLLG